jgi:hypothetical protein
MNVSLMAYAVAERPAANNRARRRNCREWLYAPTLSSRLLMLVLCTVTPGLAPAQAAGACQAMARADRVLQFQATEQEYERFRSDLVGFRRFLSGMKAGNPPPADEYNRVARFVAGCTPKERQQLLSLGPSMAADTGSVAAVDTVRNATPAAKPVTGNLSLVDTPVSPSTQGGVPATANTAGTEPSDSSGESGNPEDEAQTPEVYSARQSPQGDWLTGIDLGFQLQPDYDEDGRSSGFSQQNLFGRVFVDGIVLPNDNLHLGLDLLFAQLPTVRETEELSTEVPDSFNDIDDTVVASIYAFWEQDWGYGANKPSPDARLASNLRHGPIVRTGVSTREFLKQKNNPDEESDEVLFDTDSLVYWFGLGYRFTYLDRRNCNPAPGTRCLRSNYDRGEFELVPVFYEDFIGNDDEWRLLMSFRNRLLENYPLYLSFMGNVGRGDDIISVGLSYVLDPERVFSGVTESFQPKKPPEQ